MNSRTDLSQISTTPLARRRVMTTAAWSVPAVVVAAAAPAFASSSATAVPTGLDTDWNAAVQVQRAGQVYYVNRNGALMVSYDLYDGSDLVPDGTHYTNVFLTLSWSLSASVSPVVTAPNGWVLAPGYSLDPGVSGTAVFIPQLPLHNGATNAITLPRIEIASTTVGVNPAPGGTITTHLTGTNLGGVSGGITI